MALLPPPWLRLLLVRTFNSGRLQRFNLNVNCEFQIGQLKFKRIDSFQLDVFLCSAHVKLNLHSRTTNTCVLLLFPNEVRTSFA